MPGRLKNQGFFPTILNFFSYIVHFSFQLTIHFFFNLLKNFYFKLQDNYFTML